MSFDVSADAYQRFMGRFSEDLRTIDAVWTTTGPAEEQGYLKLRADNK